MVNAFKVHPGYTILPRCRQRKMFPIPTAAVVYERGYCRWGYWFLCSNGRVTDSIATPTGNFGSLPPPPPPAQALCLPRASHVVRGVNLLFISEEKKDRKEEVKRHHTATYLIRINGSTLKSYTSRGYIYKRKTRKRN